MDKNEVLDQEKHDEPEIETETVSETVVEKSAEEPVPEGVNWYIIQCFTGQEYKVLARIHQLMETKECKNTIFRALVPEEQTVEIKNNKRVEKTTKIYAGYVFVQMTEDELELDLVY